MNETGTKCKICFAPFEPEDCRDKYNFVVRRRYDPTIWSMDLDLHDDYPTVWGRPESVIRSINGICRCCYKRTCNTQ